MISAISAMAEERPNIIFILTDDQGYGQLGCQGHPWLETPHIDKLHSESISFTDFQVSPTCSPTRAALLTGNVPFKNGVTHTGGARSRMTLDAKTLPQYLQELGYTTGIFGKWHLGYEEPYQPGSRGFNEVFIHGYGGIGQPQDVQGNTYYDPVIRHNGKFVKTKGFCTDVFFNQAISWIDTNRTKPFFAYISTNAPHSPYIAPNDKKEKFSKYGLNSSEQGFYGMIENIDENVGRLLAKIDDWGMDSNTLVIFMSDNGFARLACKEGPIGKRHNIPLVNYQAGLKGHKKTVYEGGTRVPAFFRWKGKFNEGVECKALTAHIDFLPTLIEIAGGTPPREIDGRSLLPLLQNVDVPWEPRNLFFHIGRWQDGKADQSQYDRTQGFAVRNSRYRLVNNEELYDILNDRGEINNIIEEKPELVGELKAAYDTWWQQVRPFMVNEKVKKLAPNPFHVEYNKQKSTEGIPVTGYPEFSWDKVPVSVHFGIGEGLEPHQYDFIAKHFDFITLTAGRLPADSKSSAEIESAKAALAIKARNPKAKVLYYWASDKPKGQSKLTNQTYPGNYLIHKDKSKKGNIQTTEYFDVTRKDVQDWWSNAAADAVNKYACDGIYIDGATAGTPDGPYSRAFGSKRAANLDKGVVAMLTATREKIGPDKLMLFNPLHGFDIKSKPLGQEYLPLTDGAMIDDFARMRIQSKEYMANTIKTMETAAKDGKIIIFKGWPRFLRAWRLGEMRQTPHDNILSQARRDITFPLACFLIGAEPYCYFCYSWGWEPNQGSLDWYPVLDKPLGPPKGDAIQKGWTFSRQYQHASVFVDLENAVARIDWRNKK